jgi:hypothetical protein
MSDLIERYIHDVTKRLPEASRPEVRKELRANIDDMLNGADDETAVKRVLAELGEPRILANGYRQKQLYLISPEWMDDYFDVLKIVAIIFGTIALVVGLIDGLLNPEEATAIGIIAEVFGRVISGIVESLFTTFAIVTLIFAGISHFNGSRYETCWDPDKLPKLPKDTVKKISRIESLIGLIMAAVFGTVFTYLLMKNQFYIGWFEDGILNGINVAFFNDVIIQAFVPLYVISVILTVVVCGMKLKSGHWNIAIAVVHTIEIIFSTAITVNLIRKPNLVNPSFWDSLAAQSDITALEFANGFATGMKWFAIFLIVVVVIDVITTWVKTYKDSINPIVLIKNK